MTIGVTDPLKDEAGLRTYTAWVEANLSGATIRVLSPGENPDATQFDGVLLTGGGDVHPRQYGREDALPLCSGVSEERDRLETDLVRSAVRAGVPVLGICRGMQVANVALGGTLVPDLESGGFGGHRRSGNADRMHAVRISPGTTLWSVARSDEQVVNSSHHQAVDRPAAGLVVSARTADGVIEALELQNPGRFCLLVQWHPERMPEEGYEMSVRLLHAFADAMREHRTTTSERNSVNHAQGER